MDEEYAAFRKEENMPIIIDAIFQKSQNPDKIAYGILMRDVYAHILSVPTAKEKVVIGFFSLNIDTPGTIFTRICCD